MTTMSIEEMKQKIEAADAARSVAGASLRAAREELAAAAAARELAYENSAEPINTRESLPQVGDIISYHVKGNWTRGSGGRQYMRVEKITESTITGPLYDRLGHQEETQKGRLSIKKPHWLYLSKEDIDALKPLYMARDAARAVYAREEDLCFHWRDVLRAEINRQEEEKRQALVMESNRKDARRKFTDLFAQAQPGFEEWIEARMAEWESDPTSTGPAETATDGPH